MNLFTEDDCSSNELILESNENIQYLKYHSSPLSEILPHWESTFALRQETLKETNISTADYISQYPALNTVDGYKLVSSSFKRFYFFVQKIFPINFSVRNQKLFVFHPIWFKLDLEIILTFD